MGGPPRSRSAGGTIKQRATRLGCSGSTAESALELPANDVLRAGRFLDKKKEPKDLFRLFLG